MKEEKKKKEKDESRATSKLRVFGGGGSRGPTGREKETMQVPEREGFGVTRRNPTSSLRHFP